MQSPAMRLSKSGWSFCIHFAIIHPLGRCSLLVTSQEQVPLMSQKFPPLPPVLPPNVRERDVAPHVPHERQPRLGPKKRLHNLQGRPAPPTRVVERCTAVVVPYTGVDAGLVEEEGDHGRRGSAAGHVEEGL